MYIDDTIVAQSTPSGYGGISIIRVSGPKVSEISLFVLKKIPNPRYADYLFFYDKSGHVIDRGLAIYFPKPNSYTGEDVLELQGHGGPIIVDLLIQEILSLSENEIRIADPGEFSKRAFLNKKIDLTQAEAVVDLINSENVEFSRLAINSLNGNFSNLITKITKNLVDLRTDVESSIDFSNELNFFLSKNEIELKLDNILEKIRNLLKDAKKSKLLKEYAKIVIIGFPNAGKSTLFNKLSGKNSAIVTDIPGTTRDVLKEHIRINGVPICLIDTAGLHKTENSIEKIGIQKALEKIQKADHILFVSDSTKCGLNVIEKNFLVFLKEIRQNIPVTFIRNKIDISGKKIKKTNLNGYCTIYISAYKSKGLDLLKDHLTDSVRFKSSSFGNFLINRRHNQSLKLVKKHLQRAKKNFLIGFEDLFAEELLLAQRFLEEIVGKFSSNDLLNKIFSNFCIGK